MSADEQGHGGEQVGSVAEEAARLIESLTGWTGSSHAAGTPGAPGGDTTPGCICGGGTRTGWSAVGESASCRVCPLCQGISLLRSVRPETIERFADLVGTVATTLHDLADSRRGATVPDGTADPGARPGPDDSDGPDDLEETRP